METKDKSNKADYCLLDSGDGEKLERFGNIVLRRPDPQALWSKHLDEEQWKKADGKFKREDGKDGSKNGGWSLGANVPAKWSIDFGNLKFWIKPTAFKHVGLFPEQVTNWNWMREKIGGASTNNSENNIEVLNLFGYTGGATLACAQVGAKVVHIDGSKVAMTWARENAELSGLEKKPVRWILDDARDFVKREIKRGRKYQGIILDPPAFGHGPDGQVWKIEEDFMPLIEMCFQLLADKDSPGGEALFFLVNGYSAGYSAIAYENALRPLVIKYGGKIEKGELVVTEDGAGGTGGGRSLPCGIYARWAR